MPNNKVTDADALAYHLEPTPGKFEITASVPMTTQRDLSLAYSPGVAVPCLAIADKPELAYDYTNKGNLVADSPIEDLANITGEKHHVNVTFGSAISVKELNQLNEVIHIKDKGNNRYRIEVSSAEGRKSISHFALKNNLEVMELSSENVSLEQVFQNLTKNVDRL